MPYPYRASSVKNRQRFNWGALAPKSYSDAQNGTEAWEMQTECLVTGDEKTNLNIKLRFLHLTNREIGKVETPAAEMPTKFDFVPSLEINGKLFQAWQEAVERDFNVPTISLKDAEGSTFYFSFPDMRATERIPNADGRAAGVIVRTQSSIKGRVALRIENLPVSQIRTPTSQLEIDLRFQISNLKLERNRQREKANEQECSLFKWMNCNGNCSRSAASWRM